MLPAILINFCPTSSLVRRKRGVERRRERGTEAADRITWNALKVKVKYVKSESGEERKALKLPLNHMKKHFKVESATLDSKSYLARDRI